MTTCKKKLILFGLLLGLLLLPFSRANCATVSFDNYASSSDNDFANQFTTHGGGWIQTPTGGITGGAVQPSGISTSPIFKTAYAPLAGLTTSVYLKYDSALPATGLVPLTSARLGFVGSTATQLEPLDFNAYCWGEYSYDGTLSFYNRELTVTSGNLASFAAPQFGNWLKLTFSETYLGANQFQLYASLEDFGPSGTATPVTLGSGSIIVNNFPMAVHSTGIYAGFDGYYHVAAFDNFAVVPEPSLLGLLGLGGLLAFMVRALNRLNRNC